MEYMPTLTPLAPPQLIGIYGSPMERLGYKVTSCYLIFKIVVKLAEHAIWQAKKHRIKHLQEDLSTVYL